MSREEQELVLVPFPFQGHITPMLQLATILHSKGFSVTIAHTSFNFPNLKLIHPNFSFLQFSNAQPFDPSTQDFPSFLSNLNVICKAPLEECLTQMMKDRCHPCIIYDGNMHFAEDVAQGLNLHSIILRTSSMVSSLAYHELPRLQNEGYIPLQDADSISLAKPVPGLHPLRFKDLPFGNSKKLFIVNRLVDVHRNTRSSSAIIWNSVTCLEKSSLEQLQQKIQIPIFPIGPLHRISQSFSTSLLEEDTSCIDWLDKQVQNSVIYVSLGSIVTMEENEVIEMAWGLANSKQPFLWVISPWKLLEGFKDVVGERCCIVKWAPQKEVLAHYAVGGFWSHCGWNSTMESLCEGVPMICRPSFGDQRVNARFLCDIWKVGIELENGMERVEIERVVKRLMAEEEGNEMRQRATKLKEEIKLCVQTDGDTQSSFSDLVEFIMSV